VAEIRKCLARANRVAMLGEKLAVAETNAHALANGDGLWLAIARALCICKLDLICTVYTAGRGSVTTAVTNTRKKKHGKKRRIDWGNILYIIRIHNYIETIVFHHERVDS
jgi:hypothetical protein